MRKRPAAVWRIAGFTATFCCQLTSTNPTACEILRECISRKSFTTLSTAAISREKLDGTEKWGYNKYGLVKQDHRRSWSLILRYARGHCRDLCERNDESENKVRYRYCEKWNKSKSLHAARESAVHQSFAVRCESEVSLISNDWFLPPLLSAFADNSVELDRAISMLENLDDEIFRR